MERCESGNFGQNNIGATENNDHLRQSLWQQEMYRGRDGNRSSMSAMDPLDGAIVFDFQKLDKDGNGHLSMSELNDAIAHGRHSQAQVQLLMTVKELYRELSEKQAKGETPSPDCPDPAIGFTRDQLLKQYYSLNRNNHALLDFVGDRACRAEKHINQLYASTAESSIKPEAVRQGQVGDCYFMAALAAVANTAAGKEQIKKMINPGDDGKYLVTFPGADKPLTVEAPTQAELALYADSKFGIWPAVLEKAFGQYTNNEEHWFPSFFGTTVPADALDKGGDPGKALALLTNGKAESSVVAGLKNEDIVALLSQANLEGHCVTAVIDNEKNSLGLPADHAYSVLGYDRAHNKVIIRNPWGFGEPHSKDGKPLDGIDDGVFSITAEQFKANFLAIESCEIKKTP